MGRHCCRRFSRAVPHGYGITKEVGTGAENGQEGVYVFEAANNKFNDLGTAISIGIHKHFKVSSFFFYLNRVGSIYFSREKYCFLEVIFRRSNCTSVCLCMWVCVCRDGGDMKDRVAIESEARETEGGSTILYKKWERGGSRMVMKANEAQCEPKRGMSPWYMMVETKPLVKSTEYI